MYPNRFKCLPFVKINAIEVELYESHSMLHKGNDTSADVLAAAHNKKLDIFLLHHYNVKVAPFLRYEF